MPGRSTGEEKEKRRAEWEARNDDPFKPEREALKVSDDPFEQVLGHVADCYSLSVALTIADVDPVIWADWQNDPSNKRRYDRAIAMGKGYMENQLRGVALGTATRRGQTAAWRVLYQTLYKIGPTSPDPGLVPEPPPDMEEVTGIKLEDLAGDVDDPDEEAA